MVTKSNVLNVRCIWGQYAFLLATAITLLSFASVSIAAGVGTCRYPGTCAPPSDARYCHICRGGFVKDPEDRTKCKYANGNASLIISSWEDIKMISLDGLNTTQVIENRGQVRGIDYNFRTNTLFWFSLPDRAIYAINEESEKKSIFHDSSSRIDGVAVDWIHEHLYWVDAGRKEICVSNFNGTMKKVLFNDGLERPFSIAVDPLNGWVYWSDIFKNRIERAGLDGSGRETILGTNIEYPNGLAVDYVDNRLYWSQGNQHAGSIWSSELDGSDKKLTFNLDYSILFKIATYDNYIYFTEKLTGAIYKVNKCNGEEFTLIYQSKSFLTDMKIYEATLQPEGGENICSKRIGQCSHFCFPVPTLGNATALKTTCGCSDGLSLSADQQTCG